MNASASDPDPLLTLPLPVARFDETLVATDQGEAHGG